MVEMGFIYKPNCSDRSCRRQSGRRLPRFVAFDGGGPWIRMMRPPSDLIVGCCYRSTHADLKLDRCWTRVCPGKKMGFLLCCRLIAGPPVDAGDERLPEGDEAGSLADGDGRPWLICWIDCCVPWKLLGEMVEHHTLVLQWCIIIGAHAAHDLQFLDLKLNHE
ncbi:hypothetical protein ACLOJK_010144 [Asimina triloba]